MKNKYFFSLFIILLISLCVTFFAPISEFYKGIAVIPGVSSLVAALFQLVRDHSTFEKQKHLQRRQNIFNLGATSHMANTVFDKHVEFSEQYLAEAAQTISTLVREGPTEEAITHEQKLAKIRVEYAAWITPEIESKLRPFENAVHEIGINKAFLTMMSGDDSNHETKLKAISEMHDTFANLMNFDPKNKKDDNATIISVKQEIRKILGISELVAIREALVREASNSIQRS